MTSFLTSPQANVKHGCYFRDDQRRADYVIVLNRKASPPLLNTYIRNLESGGLQVESTSGLSVARTFYLIHIPQSVLESLAKLFNIGTDENKVITEQRKNNFFKVCSTPISEIPEKKKGEFTSAERISVINTMLEHTKYGEKDNEYGITKMIALGMVEAAYPLHDGPRTLDDNVNIQYANDRQLLQRYWANFGLFYKELPLDMIKKYYGCEIAFFFAWLQYFNLMLVPVAVIGLCVVIINVLVVTEEELNQLSDICNDDDRVVCPTCYNNEYCAFKPLSMYCTFTKWTYIFDNYLTIGFAVLMSFWATLFVNLWRRKENKLKLKWNVRFKEPAIEPRLKYLDSRTKKKYNELSGKMEPVIPNYIFFARMVLVFLICTFMILLVFGGTVVVVMYKTHYKTLMNVSGRKYLQHNSNVISTVIAATLQTIIISIFETVYGRLSIWLTNIENPRTQNEYDISVMHKKYLLSFSNSYIPLFYYAFFKGKLYTLPHHDKHVSHFERDTCQPNTCILSLCILMAFLLLFRKFAGHLITFCKLEYVKCFSKVVVRDNISGRLPQYEEEYRLSPMTRNMLLEEFCDMVIDYGYVTYFVAAFPLAPLCALLNNLLETRLKAYKLVATSRRPVPRKVPGIGSWNGILLGVTFLSMATNAVVISTTSDFIGRELYRAKYSATMIGYANFTLSEYNISDYDLYKQIIPEDKTCFYRGMRYPPGHKKQYKLTREYWTKATWELTAIIIFEHILFLCNGILGYAIPTVPSSVKQQLDMDRLLAREAKIRLLKEEMNKVNGGSCDYAEVGPVIKFVSKAVTSDEFNSVLGDVSG